MVMLMLAVALAAHPVGASRCKFIIPKPAEARQAMSRPVRPLDIVQLRDFGSYGSTGIDDRMFALSPDRRQVALELRRADPATNSYCIALVTVNIATGRLRLLDDRGQLMRSNAAYGNQFADVGSGVPAAPTPAFSPDGRWLLYIRQDAGRANVWRADLSNGHLEPITHERAGVSRAAWSNDGRRIVFSAARGLAGARAKIDAEGGRGWHYDGRIFPARRARPYPDAASDTILSIDVSSRRMAAATPSDVNALAASQSTSSADAGRSHANQAEVARVMTPPDAYLPRQHLRVRSDAGSFECRDEACAEARATWISADYRSVLFASRTGWGGGGQGFFRWTLATGRVEPLSTTSGVLLGCQRIHDRMLCASETATTPRQLVMVDPDTGGQRVVFDPNPGYARLQKGTVTRLNVTAANGTRTFADVLLPPGYDSRRRYPLVVVQYDSRGFLRGGTGDEYPIPALASAGMIVLSFQRPKDYFLTAKEKAAGFIDATRINAADWADRGNVHSALLDALDQATHRFSVDRRRVGITGLSDGTATAAYALLHSNWFSVAALSACCEEPVNDAVLAGQWLGDQLHQAGYPAYGTPDTSFWQGYSIAANAQHIHAPILIQAPDSEYVLSLPTLEVLRTAGVPVELYVFPGEYHIKWQPRHRLAVYDRSIRWFGFWFGLPAMTTPRDPADRAEIARWETLRQQSADRLLSATPSAAPMPLHP